MVPLFKTALPQREWVIKISSALSSQTRQWGKWKHRNMSMKCIKCMFIYLCTWMKLSLSNWWTKRSFSNWLHNLCHYLRGGYTKKRREQKVVHLTDFLTFLTLSKQRRIQSQMIAVNRYGCPKKCPQKWSRGDFYIYF